MPYSLIDEDDKVFKVQHKDGSVFPVAKLGLSKKLQDKIRAMSKPEKMYDGGVAQKAPADEFVSGLDQNQAPNLGVMSSMPVVPTQAETPIIEQPALDPITQTGQSAYQQRLDFLNQNLQGLPPEERERQALEYGMQAKKIAENQDKAKKVFDERDKQLAQAKLEQENVQRQALGLAPKVPIASLSASNNMSLPNATISVPGAEGQVMPDQGLAQPVAPVTTVGPMGATSGLNDMASGLSLKAKTEGQIGNEQSTVLDKLATDLAVNHAARDEVRSKIEAQNEDLYNKILNNKVEPNRYWANKSTGNKIAASIAVALGALGSAMLKDNKNDALDIINKAIDNDINAQKADMNNQQSLYQQNLQKYKDVTLAEEATRLQYNAIAQAKVNQIGAKYQGDLSKANRLLLLGQLKSQQQAGAEKLTDLTLQAQSLYGGVPANSMADLKLLVTDPKYKEHRIVVGNKVYQASSPDDKKVLTDLQSEYEPVRSMVAQLNDLQGNPKTLIGGTPENERAQTIRAFLVPRLNKMHGLNRLSEADIHLMSTQLADPAKFKEFMSGKAKNDQFMQNLNEDLESNYKNRLVNYRGAGTYKTFTPLR